MRFLHYIRAGVQTRYPKNLIIQEMYAFKKYIGILLLLSVWPLFAHGAEPEIIIEMTGQPANETTADDIVIWNKNTAQLTKLLRGKTREEALYRITSVSSKDRSVKAENGTRYRVVQYGSDEDAYRLLFLAKEPQTFVACATGTKEALELALRYHVNLGITENEFLETYAKNITPIFCP